MMRRVCASEFWYQYDNSQEGTLWSPTTGLTEAGTAYAQVYNWMVGRSMTSPCSANGTTWTCILTAPDGYQGLAVWDTSQTCNNGICTTAPYGVSNQYVQYRDLSGGITQIPQGQNPKTVPVGLKPILVEN